MAQIWFDAHLDLAYLAETGRDMHVEPAQSRGRYQPAAVTLSSLQEGQVCACLGTIFTEAIEDISAPDAETGQFAYPMGDASAAHVCGMRQLKLYQAWEQAGLIKLMKPRGQELLDSDASCLQLGVLMECADPIVDPSELEQWVKGGVIAIGLAWWHQGRYAGGNGVKTGLTSLGRELVHAMDEQGVVHDASHLCQQSIEDLFSETDKSVVATHSNSRALMDQDLPRHLADESILEIGKRGGIVGLNLYSRFLMTSYKTNSRASINDCVRHIEHVCSIMERRTGVGLGSDMDGGLTARDLPEGINLPRDLNQIADALLASGWSEQEVQGFAWGNWATFWNHQN